MLREFAADGWVRGITPEPSRLLDASGLVVTSVDDLPAEATIGSLRTLAPRATIVLTAGERGGVVVHASGLTRYRAIPAPAIVDPTGAGDVFLAALMVAWLLGGRPATSGALRFAAAAASCVIEGSGLSAVPTRARVVERLG
jgi:sugar/nucleoside kinase (ribokinase family)